MIYIEHLEEEVEKQKGFVTITPLEYQKYSNTLKEATTVHKGNID